ncbi:hypothetical protein QE152_g25312 [Popillia japonica]|uniref:Uncharacterized protein n=1 Tax=Popillia japonica TaxID=7064 RepID=A0AAW1K233_POPJA
MHRVFNSYSLEYRGAKLKQELNFRIPRSKTETGTKHIPHSPYIIQCPIYDSICKAAHSRSLEVNATELSRNTIADSDVYSSERNKEGKYSCHG